MKTSSAKAKGRGFQNWVAEKISSILGIPCGKDCLIQGREMGQSGVDVKLIGEARKLYPFSIECKKTEKWNLPAAIQQAIDNQLPETTWQVFITKNRFHKVVIMDADEWFKVWRKVLDLAAESTEKP